MAYTRQVCLAGETFDVTCFAGPNNYHCLRANGECSAGSLASCIIRATDFELSCQPAEGSKTPKADFAKNTRGKFMSCLVYTAAIHLAWGQENNHDLISNKSACVLQCTRADLQCLRTAEIDPQSQIVTLIFDVVTDKRHLHLVKAEAEADEGAAGPTTQANDEEEEDAKEDEGEGDSYRVAIW